jgi:hypothetical protein
VRIRIELAEKQWFDLVHEVISLITWHTNRAAFLSLVLSETERRHHRRLLSSWLWVWIFGQYQSLLTPNQLQTRIWLQYRSSNIRSIAMLKCSLEFDGKFWSSLSCQSTLSDLFFFLFSVIYDPHGSSNETFKSDRLSDSSAFPRTRIHITEWTLKMLTSHKRRKWVVYCQRSNLIQILEFFRVKMR